MILKHPSVSDYGTLTESPRNVLILQAPNNHVCPLRYDKYTVVPSFRSGDSARFGCPEASKYSGDGCLAHSVLYTRQPRSLFKSSFRKHVPAH